MNGWLPSSDFSFFLTPPLLVFLLSPFSTLFKFSSFFSSLNSHTSNTNEQTRMPWEYVNAMLPEDLPSMQRILSAFLIAGGKQQPEKISPAVLEPSFFTADILENVIDQMYWNNGFLSIRPVIFRSKILFWTWMKQLSGKITDVWKEQYEQVWNRYENSSVFMVTLLGASPMNKNEQNLTKGTAA